MLKGMIWFNDINLYNQCETEARRIGLTGAADYIVYCAENYIKEKQQNKFEKNIDEAKSTKKSDKIIFKKSLDLWIAVKDQAISEKTTVARLMERICSDLLQPNTGQSTIINQAEAVIQQENVNKGYTIDAPWSRKK
jgi:hypothetical protein